MDLDKYSPSNSNNNEVTLSKPSLLFNNDRARRLERINSRYIDIF